MSQQAGAVTSAGGPEAGALHLPFPTPCLVLLSAAGQPSPSRHLHAGFPQADLALRRLPVPVDAFDPAPPRPFLQGEAAPLCGQPVYNSVYSQMLE